LRPVNTNSSQDPFSKNQSRLAEWLKLIERLPKRVNPEFKKKKKERKEKTERRK
jgi:hypothetical protein